MFLLLAMSFGVRPEWVGRPHRWRCSFYLISRSFIQSFAVYVATIAVVLDTPLQVFLYVLPCGLYLALQWLKHDIHGKKRATGCTPGAHHSSYNLHYAMTLPTINPPSYSNVETDARIYLKIRAGGVGNGLRHWPTSASTRIARPPTEKVYLYSRCLLD